MKKICGLITAAVLVTATAVTSFAATDNVTADINKVPHTALNDENKYKYDAGNICLTVMSTVFMICMQRTTV